MQTGGAIFAVIYLMSAIWITMFLISREKTKRIDRRWRPTRRSS